MTARAWLFVPGDRPDRFAKAAASGADEVICDLEDAVTPAGKEQARHGVRAWLGNGGRAWVRVNAHGTPWHQDDVAALRGAPGLRGLVVPKAEDRALLRGLDSPVVALIETAVGVHRAVEIAAAVDRLAFGSIDFALDIDAEEERDSLLLARSSLVQAARVAGRPAPIDGVTTAFAPAAVTEAAAYARRLGFGAKLCVHPTQVAPVQAAFAPTVEQIAWARRILRGDGAARAVDGHMVDKPVLERARRILAQTAEG